MLYHVSHLCFFIIVLGTVLIIASFVETSPGGYKFTARMWRTHDGCHNLDFDGALDAGHGWCCGKLPCDIKA
jgi:hypothetical protein